MTSVDTDKWRTWLWDASCTVCEQVIQATCWKITSNVSDPAWFIIISWKTFQLSSVKRIHLFACVVCIRSTCVYLHVLLSCGAFQGGQGAGSAIEANVVPYYKLCTAQDGANGLVFHFKYWRRLGVKAVVEEQWASSPSVIKISCSEFFSLEAVPCVFSLWQFCDSVKKSAEDPRQMFLPRGNRTAFGGN